MCKRGFALCPEGVPMIVLSIFCALFFAILDWKIVALVFWLFTIFSLHFFRDPDRVIPQEPDIAVSPADGKIIKISHRPDPFTGELQQCVSIFMNVFNVHVNRAPLDCEVEEMKYFPGAFVNASFDKASEKNERCAWRLVDKNNAPWTMVQIAGLIARRIVCFGETGDKFCRGERVGMIRFGSRVDLYLPQGYVATVDLNDKVHAGETIIAHKQ